MFLLEPSTCKLNIDKLVLALTIKETDVQRLPLIFQFLLYMQLKFLMS